MRCFIACFPIPDSAQRLAAAVRSSWVLPAAARLIPAVNYHMTLQFLGQRPLADVPQILAEVAALGGVASRARVLGFGGFPDPARARVVFARLEVSDEQQGWAGGNDEFVPHISIARARRGVPVPGSDGVAGIELELAAPALYESVSVADGVRYRKLSADSIAGD